MQFRELSAIKASQVQFISYSLECNCPSFCLCEIAHSSWKLKVVWIGLL